MTFPECGCNFEGILDTQATWCKRHSDPDQITIKQNLSLPSTVILPEERYQSVLTGIESHESRVCRGYSWPKESRFDPQNGIRRVPVSLAWHLLVAAGDKKVSWKAADNRYVPVSDIIAEHTVSLLQTEELRHIVLSIPNNLHEFGQDALLTSLRKKGCRATLLWRPIASAIDWCSSLSQIEINRMEKDDHFYCIHLGADLFEFVSLHIRKVERNGHFYAVPIRSHPSVSTTFMSGSLILASVAEHIAKTKYNTSDENVVWQIFTSLSQLWSMDDNKIQTKQFIDTGNCWNIFTDKIENFITDTYLQRPEWLLQSIKRCCDINLSEQSSDLSSVAQWLKQQIHNLVSNCDDDEPGGAIISGAFRKFKINGSETLEDIVSCELQKNINLGYQENLAAATYIYNDPDTDNDHISEGCLHYAQKEAKGLPSYYDVLPKLDIRVRNINGNGNGNEYKWEPLVTTDEIEGGKTYSNEIKKRFSVLPGTEHIDFFLRRMDADKYRKLPFQFPTPPSEKIIVDLHITMKPGQGFASVELIPDKPDLFGIKHLFLDWQRMEASELPKQTVNEFSGDRIAKISYPEVFTLKADFQLYINNRNAILEYINTSPTDSRYAQVLDNLKTAVKARQVINSESCGLVDSNGILPEPNNDQYIDTLFNDSGLLINQTIKKIDTEIKMALLKQGNLSPYLNELIKISAFFFIKAPYKSREYLRSLLITNGVAISSHIIYSIGKCFHIVPEIKLFFEIAIERIQQNTEGTDVWVWGINKILMHRNDAPKALKREQALFLAAFARDKMKSEQQKIKNKFKNAANLFLYLLRWRTIDIFLPSSIPQEYKLVSEVKDILNNAVQHTQNRHVKEILEQIAKYIEFKGDYSIQGFVVSYSNFRVD